MEALAQPGSGSSSLLPQGTPRRDAGHVFDKRNNGGVIPLAASSVLYSMESFVDYCSHWQRYFEFASHVHSVTQVFDLRVYFPSRFKIPRQYLGRFDIQRSTTRQASTHGLNEQGRINTSFGAVDPMFKGVWSTAVNFVLVPPPDTKLAQYPPPDKRSDDSLGRHGLGGWAYCPRRSARASLA